MNLAEQPLLFCQKFNNFNLPRAAERVGLMGNFIKVFLAVVAVGAFISCGDNGKDDDNDNDDFNVCAGEVFHVAVWDPTMNGGAGGIRLTSQQYLLGR
jgi:hypothetical protein